MVDLTLVFTYYNQPQMLAEQVRVWQHYPPEQRGRLRIVVVDDGSAPPMAPPHVPGLAIAALRIHDDLPWHQDEARNLAMRHVSGWAALLDIDHVVTTAALTALLALSKQPGYWYPLARATLDKARLRDAPNVFLMHAKDFQRLGGYDPAEGYGTDRYMVDKRNAHMRVGERLTEPLMVYRASDVADCSTTGLSRKVQFRRLPQPLPYRWDWLTSP